MDQIVVDGTLVNTTYSWAGTNLYFDYNGDHTSDGSVLLSGVSQAQWQSMLADTSNPVLVQNTEIDLGAHLTHTGSTWDLHA
jgi:hypothetical protein